MLNKKKRGENRNKKNKTSYFTVHVFPPKFFIIYKV